MGKVNWNESSLNSKHMRFKCFVYKCQYYDSGLSCIDLAELGNCLEFVSVPYYINFIEKCWCGDIVLNASWLNKFLSYEEKVSDKLNRSVGICFFIKVSDEILFALII